MAEEKDITQGNGKGKQYRLSCNIALLGRKSSDGRERKFRGRKNQDLNKKNRDWEKNIKLQGTLYTTVLKNYPTSRGGGG